MKALLLMRLDSGNFTPDQVEWVARQLDDWVPSLTLVPPPGEGAHFFVDLTGTQGLRRRDKPNVAGRVLMLDAGPAYARVVEQLRWLPEQDEEVTKPGDLPAREQRLLLMRLASLFGPEAIAHAPRAERFRTDGEVRVVVGLQALTRAIAEIDKLPDGRARSRRRLELRRDHADRGPRGQPRVGRAPRARQHLADDRPQRHGLPPASRRPRKRPRGWASWSRSRRATPGGWAWCGACSASRSTR